MSAVTYETSGWGATTGTQVWTTPRPVVRVDSYERPQAVLPLAARRAARARMMQRRRRSLAGLALIVAFVVLAWPAHAFGSVRFGSFDNVASQYNSGMTYVVQSGDTLQSIASLVDPSNPGPVIAALRHELRSDVLSVGEHVLIP